ncbi:MAG TPA: sigma-70 family RNA polymerase sigma factor [Planctomycetaceae bacterium]|nr:sigma-70 family RNA polymerase sigma factor [Planctomycetaceae bacterium]
MPTSPAEPFPEDDLPELLREAKRGSQEAIGALLERHRAYLWALANEEISGDSHLTFTVADVVQSAQLEAMRDLAAFRGSSDAEFRAWLRHILRNNVLDLRRARGRRIPRAADQPALVDKQVDVNDRSPSSQVSAGELGDKLRAAIEKLPVDERTVIEMHYFQDKTYAEIGECLNRTPEAVRKLWGRALVRLQSATRSLQ